MISVRDVAEADGSVRDVDLTSASGIDHVFEEWHHQNGSGRLSRVYRVGIGRTGWRWEHHHVLQPVEDDVVYLLCALEQPPILQIA